MRTRSTLAFSCMVWQEETFSFLLPSVAEVRGRQLSFPPSFLPAVCWVEGRQAAPFSTSLLPRPCLGTQAQGCNVFYHSFCHNCKSDITVLLIHTVRHVQLLVLPVTFLCSPVFNFFLHISQGHLVPRERPWESYCN